ncbi:polyphosphate kinase 2 family protein [Phycicoccus sp. BSK3Z-2]|uniref:Polyphosphate kinase 2 family protein n=1 Tax=Phycicoccus avicenniae TaxID=2828860 RepID=A0A941HZ12_9MICO|nr:polyphosphate kinase 2 family protein [Phycicoccus avicenniae]MBR7742430.1 polyphosphate kinase 2 family protein [Phycicoccus avicenniae]
MAKGSRKKSGKKADAASLGKGKPPKRARVADEELTGKAARKLAKQKAKEKQARADETTGSWSDLLRFRPGDRLADVHPRSTPGFAGKKKHAEEAMAALQARLGDLQERLYAEASGGGGRSVLLVIQGMDTAGKGGIMRHVVGSVDPQGVAITAFKVPTAEERRHPFLWRIRRALPAAGRIGVFDRSHYEDVLVVRVHDLVPRAQWARRYGQINRFEEGVVDGGTSVVKVMLHVSQKEQKARLGERLRRPDKFWKYNPGDVDERMHWDAYQEAYQVALERCSTDAAPWHVVPADRKWFARLAVTNLLLEALEAMDPQWPAADFDVDAERERLAAT